MSKNDFNNIKVPQDIRRYVNEGLDKAEAELKLRKKRNIKRNIGIVASVVITMITIGITNPVLASQIPVIGSVFKIIEKNLIFPGKYSQYATSVNEKVESSGIGITLSEILCDGQSIYVTYKVESEEPFKYTSYDNSGIMNMKQLITDEAYSNVDFTSEELDTSGFAGLEGEFVDEHTFIGVEEYKLSSINTEIPDEFMFKNKIIRVENYDVSSDKTTVIRGKWAFEVPVKLDKSLRKVVNVTDIKNEFIKVNSLSITPFGMVVDVAYNEGEWHEYKTTFYDENGEILQNSQTNVNDKTGDEKFFMESPNQNSNSIRMVVVKTSELKKYTKYEDISKDAIFDKIIDIK
ncbi:MAG: DUF4179 domain-containing protein [Clostridium sp.]